MMLKVSLAVLCLSAAVQCSDEKVHVSGNYAPTKVFAMPYGAYGAGPYGGAGRYGYAYPPVYNHAAYSPVHEKSEDKEEVHVSGNAAPTKVFAMPYGAYGAGPYGGAGRYGYAHPPVYNHAAYSPVHEKSDDKEEVHVSGNAAPTKVFAMPYSAYGAGAYGYAHPSPYGYNYGHGQAVDGKLVGVIDRPHGYGNVGYGISTPFLTNQIVKAPAHHNERYPYSTNGHGAVNYGYNYGLPYNYGSYGHGQDGKVVQVIDRSHSYGNVGYGQPTPFLTNQKV